MQIDLFAVHSIIVLNISMCPVKIIIFKKSPVSLSGQLKVWSDMKIR